MRTLSVSRPSRSLRVFFRFLSGEDRIAGRMLCIAAGIVLAIAGLAVQLVRLHSGHVKVPLDPLRADRAYEQIAVRGNIYDRNGRRNILAMDMKRDFLWVSPKLIIRTNQLMTASYEISQALKVPQAQILERINKPNMGYIVVSAQTPIDQVADLMRRIREKKLVGIHLDPTKTRMYPYSELMASIIGHVDDGGMGQGGIELVFNKILDGTKGFSDDIVDAIGNRRQNEQASQIAALRGADVYLNVDLNIQHIVQSALKETVEKFRAKSACAIVQDPRSGSILAMGCYPTYDPNNISQDDVTSGRTINSAIGFVHEPGSTFKAVVFSAALNERLVTPDTIIDCENGTWVYGGRELHDFHPYGNLTVADGIKKSSNIMAAKLAIMLGKEKLYKYLRAFSIGERLGVDLPAEEKGILYPPNLWCGIDITRIPMGQSVAVTPLQLLGVYSAIANNGRLMRPHVVNKITDAGGAELLKSQSDVLSQPISPETAATMRWLLSRVTEEGGTGVKARIDGFEVAGKTGSAQKVVDGKYQAYVASFVGFFPAESPEVAMVVVVDEPKESHLGGTVASPAFSRIGTMAARYLEMQPPRAVLAMGKAAGNETR